MIKTKITELLDIEHPIIGGTMMHLSRAEFVAAISEAGCLGIMASAIYRDKESFRADIRKVRQLTDRPFGVNLNLFPAMRPIDNEEYISVILDEGVKIVETSGHKAPEEFVARLKKEGITVIHKCVGVRYALKAERVGVDAVTVVGFENGGSTGMLDITTLCLVPRVVDSVSIPVIGGGGVADGRGLMAVLSLGAEGVIIGTRFLLTDECPLHTRIKDSLKKAEELDSRLVMRSIKNTHRVLNNKAAQMTYELEQKGASLEEMMGIITGQNTLDMIENGNVDSGLLPCGQDIGLVTEIKPVKEVVEDIMRQAIDVQRRMDSFF